MVVCDEPVAVDLPKARRPPNREIGPVPVLQGAAHPIEAVPECHVIAQREREVANLVTERTLEHRKSVRPVFLFCLCSHVPQRRYEVERHDVWSVKRHHTLEVHGAKRLHPPVYSLSDVGFISRSLYCHGLQPPDGGYRQGAARPRVSRACSRPYQRSPEARG